MVGAGETEVVKLQLKGENQMDVYKNARLTQKGRVAMVRAVVEGGCSKVEAARRFNATAIAVAK